MLLCYFQKHPLTILSSRWLMIVPSTELLLPFTNYWKLEFQAYMWHYEFPKVGMCPINMSAKLLDNWIYAYRYISFVNLKNAMHAIWKSRHDLDAYHMKRMRTELKTDQNFSSEGFMWSRWELLAMSWSKSVRMPLFLLVNSQKVWWWQKKANESNCFIKTYK